MPFELGVHKCYVVFSDENVGELQYTIIGKVDLPEETDTYQLDCNAEETFAIEKQFNFKNERLESAKNMIEKAAQMKNRDAYGGLLGSSD